MDLTEIWQIRASTRGRFHLPAEPLSRTPVLPAHSGDYAALVPSLQMPEPGASTAEARVVGLAVYQKVVVTAS